jgi:hypothetical protein
VGSPPPDVPDPVARERWPLARVLAAGTVAVLALGACSDTPPTVPPDPSHAAGEGDPEALEVVELAVPFVPASGPRPTLRDELSAMAGRVPGGFGGMYSTRTAG